MKTLGIAFLLLSMAACSTHPDSLLLVKRGVELVDFVKYAAKSRPGTRALALNFEGKAPYAAIASEGRQAQFRCYVLDSEGKRITEIDGGFVFFEGPAAPPERKTFLVPGELSEQGELYRYKAVIYPGLKANTVVNRPADFDLLTRDYERIQCQLVGVQMVGGFMYSNELYVSKSELLELHESSAGAVERK